MSRLASTFRSLGIAARLMVILTVILGVGYPLVVTGVGRLGLGSQADGSLVRDSSGTIVGSRLIGQSFTDASGKPLAQYFQSRPSAAGSGYDADASGGSNLGPESPELVDEIATRKREVAQFNGVPESAVPPDAVTASASGLDPDISPAYAAIQVERVARTRGLTVDEVRRLVVAHTQGRTAGFLGQPRVNVLELNLALDDLGAIGRSG
jgi:potassium-transporting ATPase KdpC subunit